MEGAGSGGAAAGAITAPASSRVVRWLTAPSARWCAIALAYAAALAVAVRHLSYGVDLQDEAYYLTFAYRFARGDLPILADKSMHQFGSLLMVLPVKAYLAVVGSTNGIVYFGRACYLVVLLAALGALASVLRRLVGWWWAALICLPLVFYSPLGLSGLGYNSVSALALLLASASALRAVSGGGRGAALASGLLWGVGVVAYPPLVVPVAVALAMLGMVLVIREGPRRALVPVVGFAAAVAPMVAYAVWCGFGAVADVLKMAWLGGSQGGGLDKLGLAMEKPFLMVAAWPVPLLLALAAVRYRERRPLLAIAAVLLLPFAALGGVPGFVIWRPMAWMSGLVMYLGALSVVLFFAVPRTDETRLVMLIMVIPGALAALVMSYTSYINVAVAGQALLPALVATLLFGVRLVRATRGRPHVLWREAGAILLVLSLAAVMARVQWLSPFQDEPPAQLTATVRGGPWDGLMTTPERRAYVELLARDLARVVTRDSRVFVYSWCPGAYLIAQGRVATPMIGMGSPMPLRVELVRRLRESRPPDVVVEDRYYWWTQSPFDPIRRYVSDEGYVARILEGSYTVHVRRGER